MLATLLPLTAPLPASAAGRVALVADCWHDDYRGAPADGSAWTRGGDCDRRVLRGGSWETVPSGLRSANRYRNEDNRGSAMVGFRVARALR